MTANDEIPIWDADGTGEPTKKITAQQLAAAVVALANLVTSVNNQTGAVSITPADIGAVAKSGDTMTRPLTIKGSWPRYNLQPNNGSQTTVSFEASDTDGHGFFETHSLDGTKHEWYNLPNSTTDGGYYNILTDKFPVTVQQGGTGATTPDGACANIGAVKKGSFTSTLLYSGNPAVNATFTLSDYVSNYNILRIVDTYHYYCDVYMPVYTSAQTIMANGSTSYPYDGTPRFLLWEFTAISSDGINYTVARKAQANITSTGVEAIITSAEFGIEIYGLR